MYYSQNGLLAVNGTRIETMSSIYGRTERLQPKYRALNAEIAADLRKETAAGAPNYMTGFSSASGLGGSRPPGLGFAFGDSWARTQRGVMEFHMPMGQVDNINMALRFAFENAFVAKAMRLKTLFTSKGIKNATADDPTNDFLDQVVRKLYLQVIFRQAVWMYYTVGLVPVLLPEQDQEFSWVQLLDPRMVRVERAYGKLFMYLLADQRMREAINDKEGRKDPRNKDYYDAMPKSWRKQLEDPRQRSVGGEVLIKLPSESYIVLENRYNSVDRSVQGFDGTPLQPYFSACEQYRMLAAGDFATAFLMKNIIAAVSVGDPKAEGPDLYMRPDDQVLLGLMQLLQNPNQAQHVYVDPTFAVRYFTPDPSALDNKKYNEPKEVLKNLLPSPLWASDGSGSFAAATVEMQELEEEAVACQNDFDDQFWQVIYERAAEGRIRVAKKNVKPPVYDRSALRDRIADLKSKGELYANGGLDIKSLIAAHGYDPEVIAQRMRDQMGDVKKGIYMTAFEQKQGIVAAKTYGINKLSGGSDGGSGGRPKVAGSKPQSESKSGRTPRPSERSK